MGHKWVDRYSHIYLAADLVLLDDVLSAVDAQVASWIISNAILSPLMTQKTRILCTHNIQGIYAVAADMVVIMDKGQVKWVGSPADCSSSTYAAFVRQEEIKTSSETKAHITEKGNTLTSFKKVTSLNYLHSYLESWEPFSVTYPDSSKNPGARNIFKPDALVDPLKLNHLE
ncbi:ABC transporter C family member 13 [Tanacetum coccineum]|uniref:ABC transporter C family member 13 n=1 Tax=Tanacetum coccineum TaxID=301880 RepID=A0ABQ4WM71_9ASTR